MSRLPGIQYPILDPPLQCSFFAQYSRLHSAFVHTRRAKKHLGFIRTRTTEPTGILEPMTPDLSWVFEAAVNGEFRFPHFAVYIRGEGEMNGLMKASLRSQGCRYKISQNTR